jgi:organic hydroperoxide reductase OsmC/OhrA
MEIRAVASSTANGYAARVETAGREQNIDIRAKPGGEGSSVNGGELLFLALATCYCNDVYREAAARGVRIDAVEVCVQGLFGPRGDPARDISYEVSVQSPESVEVVEELLRATDSVAEIQNTLRQGFPVRLGSMTITGSPTAH